MDDEVKLYGTWASPYSRRIELALKLKGVKYNYFEENLSKKSPDLLKYNPVHKQIPVLVHNEKPIVESLVILEYIDETWTNYPLLPQDLCDKAVVRFWSKLVDDKLQILPMATKLRLATGKEQENLVQEVREQLNLLERENEGKELYGGNRIGYLDIVAFSVVYWFKVRQEAIRVELMNEEKFPRLYKWMEKLRGMNMVNECVPPDDKHVAYIKTRLDSAAAASK